MKLIRKLFTLLVVLSLSLTVFSVNALAGKAEPVTIKIGYLPLTHALPLFVEKELYNSSSKNVKIDLVKFGSWPELTDALNSGRIQGASVLVELALKAKANGIDLKAVALGHRDGNVVVVSKDIKKAEDLKGKTIAIPHRLSSHNILLYQLLKNANLTVDDVKITELPPPEMPAALSEGRISGYIVAEPFGAKSVALGEGKVLFESNALWKDSICCSLVLRNEFIKNNKKAAQEFVANYAKAGKYISSKGKNYKTIAKKYLNVDDKVLDLSLKWISYHDLKIQEKDYEILKQYVKELKLIDKIPSFKDFVDSSLIDSVK